jgi:hypothetical protein
MPQNEIVSDALEYPRGQSHPCVPDHLMAHWDMAGLHLVNSILLDQSQIDGVIAHYSRDMFFIITFNHVYVSTVDQIFFWD